MIFKPIIVSIDDMDKFKQKNDEEETFSKQYMVFIG